LSGITPLGADFSSLADQLQVHPAASAFDPSGNL